MSGPKLSAYELEQMRKAELERIQREIVRIKALSMQDIQEAQQGNRWCEEEIRKLERQKLLLDSCVLPDDEKQRVSQVLQNRRATVQSLQRYYCAVQTAVYGSGLEEVQTEQRRIAAQMAQCREQKDACEAGRAAYERTLAKVADDLCKGHSMERYSLEAALADIPVRIAQGEDLREEKQKLIENAQWILNHSHTSPADKARAVKAINRIYETKNAKELRELKSLVIGEIERAIRKTGPLLEEYQQLLSSKNAIAASLGAVEPEQPQPFESLEQLKQLIVETKDQIRVLERRLMEEAERAEIARCIDLAMEELGYDFIGKKRAESSASQIKLYEFSDKAGLQVTQRQDGVVRIKVVGLANQDKMPTEQEKDTLYLEQMELCEEYDEIVEALRRKGVIMRAGTQKRNPAHKDFGQFVNVAEYNADYMVKQTDHGAVEQTVAETAGREKRRNRRSARAPKVLSKQ